tara:strand:+ start:469 stop:720 length:252 start_codon:yes stop_codon:yes gene_type:complete
MAKYKAKDSYLTLDDMSNFNKFSSPAKHNVLMDGRIIELSQVPDKLKKHLELVEEVKPVSKTVVAEKSVSPQKQEKSIKKETK